MNYYAVNFGNFTTLIVKCDLGVKEFLTVLNKYSAIKGNGGMVHNLRKFESFYELSGPDLNQKRNALSLDRLM